MLIVWVATLVVSSAVIPARAQGNLQLSNGTPGCNATPPVNTLFNSPETFHSKARDVDSSNSIIGEVVFSWRSLNGVTGSISSAPNTFTSNGQTFTFTATINGPHAHDIYTVTCTLGEIVAGTFIPDESATDQFRT